MHLYLIRHPRPTVAAHTCYGRTDLTVDEVTLSLSVQKLLPLLPDKAHLFSSPLRRCTTLTQQMASRFDSPPIYDERLREMYFGNWEMRCWDDIPRMEIDAWVNDMTGYRPGGGETVLEVAQRVRDFRDDLAGMDIEHAVVICHAGTIRLLAACERGLSVPEMARYAAQKPHRIGYGEMLIVDC